MEVVVIQYGLGAPPPLVGEKSLGQLLHVFLFERSGVLGVVSEDDDLLVGVRGAVCDPADPARASEEKV